MLTCQAKAEGTGVTLADSPMLGTMQATMVPEQAYQVAAWYRQVLYLSLNGSPRGWAAIPQAGLSLEGSGCMLGGGLLLSLSAADGKLGSDS